MPGRTSGESRSFRWHLLVALGFVLVLLLVDLAIRWRVISGWGASELRQYGLSWFGSFAFWWGVAVLGALGRGLGRVALAGLGLVGAGALLVPVAFSVVYHRFPNEDAFVFLANEWRFVLKTALKGAPSESAALFVTSAGLVFGLLAVARRVHPPRGAVVAAVGALLLDVSIMAVSTFAGSLPLAGDQVSLRLAARLVQWGGAPPPFFLLNERLVPPMRAPRPPGFNVLLIVQETVGAAYLRAPDGRAVAPHLLALSRDPAVVWLSRHHSVSSCTDVSVPAILSGLSSAAPLERQLTAALPFDLARSAGAYTFVTASQRLDWAHFDRYLGDGFDRRVGAETIDPQNEDVDVGVDDGLAYDHALAAMEEAARRGQPFVGLVRTNGTHGPYRVDEQDAPWLEDPGFGPGTTGGFVRYLNALHLADRRFGAFWAEFLRRPWAEDTLVVVTADHGEAFGQHDSLWHCGSFTPEESWVPGALRLPRAVRGQAERVAALRARADDVVPTIDLIPTVVDLLGWREAFDRQFDGRSLAVSGGPRRFAFTNCSDLRRCPVADFGFFDGESRWLFSGSTRSWRRWSELVDPLALHELAIEPEALAALRQSIETSPDRDIARRIIGW